MNTYAPSLPSPESIPTSQQIIPFCIVALDNDSPTNISEVLSNFYLVEQFDMHYNGLLSQSKEWEKWKTLINQLTDIGISTYKSQHNLHRNQEDIKRFSSLYFNLKEEVLGEINRTKKG